MKKILFTVIALITFQFSQAQSIDSLYGQWRFDGFYETAEDALDTTIQEKMGKMFESLGFQFKSDGVITLSMFDKNEDATYVYNAETKTIDVVSDKRPVKIIILEFKGNKMAVQFVDMKIWVKLE